MFSYINIHFVCNLGLYGDGSKQNFEAKENQMSLGRLSTIHI